MCGLKAAWPCLTPFHPLPSPTLHCVHCLQDQVMSGVRQTITMAVADEMCTLRSQHTACTAHSTQQGQQGSSGSISCIPPSTPSPGGSMGAHSGQAITPGLSQGHGQQGPGVQQRPGQGVGGRPDPWGDDQAWDVAMQSQVQGGRSGGLPGSWGSGAWTGMGGQGGQRRGSQWDQAVGGLTPDDLDDIAQLLEASLWDEVGSKAGKAAWGRAGRGSRGRRGSVTGCEQCSGRYIMITCTQCGRDDVGSCFMMRWVSLTLYWCHRGRLFTSGEEREGSRATGLVKIAICTHEIRQQLPL